MKKEVLGKGIEVLILENMGDERGCSYNIPKVAFNYISEIKDIHVATIVPEAVRGNHYHVGRKEIIIVWFLDSWLLAWDQENGTRIESKAYDGSGLLLIEVDMEISHAIKNTGDNDLIVMALSNNEYNIENTDTYRRVVMP